MNYEREQERQYGFKRYVKENVERSDNIEKRDFGPIALQFRDEDEMFGLDTLGRYGTVRCFSGSDQGYFPGGIYITDVEHLQMVLSRFQQNGVEFRMRWDVPPLISNNDLKRWRSEEGWSKFSTGFI